MKVSDELNITICSDNLEISNETDIFYSNKLSINKLIMLAKNYNVDIQRPIFLNKKYRFKNKELAHLEENIYSSIYKRYEDQNENIRLFLASNPYSEVEFVANKIVEEVRDNDIRYRDIGIITKNLDTYSSLIRAIFSKYDIPVYIDEKKTLGQNILIKYITCLLDVFAKNWSFDSVIAYIKTGFCDIEKNEIYFLENYAKKWGIKYSKWYKEDWNFGEDDKEKLERLNDIRKRVVKPLLRFKEKCLKNAKAKDITKAIYEFLNENEIDKKLMHKAKGLELENPELVNEYEASYNLTINILDEIVKIFGDEKVSYEKYESFLKISFSENELGKIPAGADMVTVR